MHVPEVCLAGDLGGAGELIRPRAEEVAPDDVLERPAARAVLRDADLELAAGVLLLALAGDVPEGVDGEILVQVGAQVDEAVAQASGVRLEGPHLLLLEGGAVRVYLEAERLRGEVAVLGVDEADGPATLLLVLGDDVAAPVHFAVAVPVHDVHVCVGGWTRQKEKC